MSSDGHAIGPSIVPTAGVVERVELVVGASVEVVGLDVEELDVEGLDEDGAMVVTAVVVTVVVDAGEAVSVDPHPATRTTTTASDAAQRRRRPLTVGVRVRRPRSVGRVRDRVR